MTAIPSPPGGALDGPLHRLAVRAYYEDTDTGGVVYHANYLRWYERARTDMLRLFGIRLSDTIAEAVGTYVVSECTLKFTGSARLDDVVLIESRVVEARRASVVMAQRALVEDCEINRATLRLGFVTMDGKPRRQPDGWLEAFRSVMAEEPEQELQ